MVSTIQLQWPSESDIAMTESSADGCISKPVSQ